MRDLIELLRRQAPHLGIRDLWPLARGYERATFAADGGGLVVRVALGAEAVGNMPRERRVLKLLAATGTTLAVPRVVFAAEGVAVDVITRVPGGELTDARYAALDAPQRRRLADDLARFLAELHRPELAARAAAAGVPARSPWPLPAERIVAELSPLLADDAGRVRFLEAAMGEYDAIRVACEDRVLVHNDLREDNMGFDPEAGRLCGAFDFGDVALDDRHRDFRGFPSIGLHLHEAIMRGYARLTGRELSPRRTLLYNAAGELSHLVHVIETGGGRAAAEFVGPCLAELVRRLGR